jgi:hypothetical protein
MESQTMQESHNLVYCEPILHAALMFWQCILVILYESICMRRLEYII